ncbi:nucleoside-diphosphate sugar epimerase/dehydratase [Cupriavidus basilensis]|uniref:Nucleoside-diphosphate sugar epimerase/dehydratase n=1 Tax=Cupriavidus basilensis TaxID=68895 RepID=A0ABT6AGU0_9BURK|nr:nucleoside-diphosphate sugar epimerase/dehydratase [Cupriavidus basilensis]MDF3831643.1 nucleoside-diphosphate sugar epimerase/dehydratase [Cupriavidus basilensis]
MTSALTQWLLALSRRSKVALMVTADLLVLPLCFSLALLLRKGDTGLLNQYGALPPLAIALLTIPVFYFSGLYRTVLRYIDLKVLWVSGLSLAALISLTYFVSVLIQDDYLPRTGLLIYWFVAFAYVVISRFLARALLRASQYRKNHGKIARLAIFGAGEAGFQLALAMRASPDHRALCFFDHDITLNNKIVAGLPVYDVSRMTEQLARLDIDEVVLAIPSASPERRREVLETLRKQAVEVRTLPTLLELVDGKITTQSIRDIRIEDLLGREPVPPNKNLFAKCTQKKAVMVTGAGGSIGSELCRQIASQGPRKLVLFEHSEFALYTIEQELRQHFPNLDIAARIGSVCDPEAVTAAVRQNRIDTIYHAAAYKHVPLVESNMPEGIRNNVMGSLTVADIAHLYGVETCVLVSTDKAVRPTNIMGASKRMAELVFQAAAARPRTRTTFSMVRFGNVLGSSGSVVPLFRKQIENGGPITITHADVVRYFMLIPEAAQLVIQAGAMAKGGEVFVLDMGDPVRIVDLARTMIEMSGLQEKTRDNPGGDIEIKVVGLRPGEKLYEELLIGGDVIASSHARIMCAKEHSLAEATLHDLLAALFAACDTRDTFRIQSLVQSIVPEYAPYSSIEEGKGGKQLRPPRVLLPFPLGTKARGPEVVLTEFAEMNAKQQVNAG